MFKSKEKKKSQENIFGKMENEQGVMRMTLYKLNVREKLCTLERETAKVDG